MGKINLSDIQPGMILATDVTNLNGQLLLPSGIELKDKHLEMLQAWGIPEVDVQGADRDAILAQTVSKIDPEILAKVEAELTENFRNTDRKTPFNSELFNLCMIRKTRQPQ